MMTLRERAQQFIDTVPLYHLDTEGKIDAIAKMATADRQALQAEIVSRLQLERNSSRHDASGGYYFNVAMSAAIEIVQSVFAQSDQSGESKPEEESVSFHPFYDDMVKDTCGKCGRVFPWPEHQKPEAKGRPYPIGYTFRHVSAMEKTISEAESNRRVLAEREACASVAEVMTVGEIQEFARLRGRNIAAAIRARSNPAPEIIACSNEAPKPGQVAMVKDGKVIFVDPPPDWKHLGDGVFQIPESDVPPVENKAPESPKGLERYYNWLELSEIDSWPF